MNIYAIADLHLSLGTDKPMDVFPGWEGYLTKLTQNWKEHIAADDIVVLGGDTSWGMTLEESLRDFQYLESLPGKKYLLKGNHDYWWSTAKKMNAFFELHGLTSLHLLHNNCVLCGKLALCGTRGWIFENGEPADSKIVAREAQRLELSLQSGGEREKIVFLHYPPIYMSETNEAILEVLKRYEVTRCYFGHIHGGGIRYAQNGRYRGVDYRLISCDGVSFAPVFIAGVEEGVRTGEETGE